MARLALEVVPPNVDAQAAQAARAHQGQLMKPAGALTVLEEIAIALAAIQGRERPRARPAEALLFAADHPVAAHGVSAYPPEATARMVANVVGGGAAASVLCRTQGIPLTVIDVGVAQPVAMPGEAIDGVRLIREDVADDEEGDLLQGQAMSARTFERAVTAGIDAVDRLAEDTRILILGEMGIGNSTCAAAVAAALLGRDGAELTGSGTGVAGGALARKREVVQRAAALGYGQTPSEILAAVGGRELAAIAGAVGRAAERGICVLVDGFIVSAAVLAAVQASPGILPYLLFGHCSAEPGHRLVLEAMQARPLLELGLRLGEGTGALAAFPLVELACALHDEMATSAP